MVKVIIIDLGGVYFGRGTDIALKKIRKIVKVSNKRIDEIFKGYPKREGFLYRKGKLTKREFWKRAIKKLKIDRGLVPKIQEIWHSSYKPVKGMKDLVSKLRKNYTVVAFSGNIRERVEYLNNKYGLYKDFDNFVLSCNVGFSKREMQFYKILINRLKAKPKECVLIDDYQKFLDTAKSFGLKTILFKNSKQLKASLREISVKI